MIKPDDELPAIEELHISNQATDIIFLANERGENKTPITNVVSKGQSTYSHFHGLYEIVYVNEGFGTFLIDNQVYLMKPGDIFLISPNVIHHPSPDDHQPYNCSVLLFKPTLISQSLLHANRVMTEYHSLGSYVEISQSHDRQSIALLMNHIGDEIKTARFGFELSCLTYLLQLIILLCRAKSSFSETKSPAETFSSKSQIWMNAVLSLIDEHYLNRPFTLNALAEQALVSPEHFSRIFKKTTGMTLPAYINIKRLHHAKTLLSTTSLSIQQVSDICGFNDVSYFCKKFKALWHHQPSEFRGN